MAGQKTTANAMSPAKQIPGRRLCALLALTALASGLASCGDGRPPAAAVGSAAPRTVADHFDIALGGRVVHLQAAVLEPEMERGLMERRNLGADEGMIFIFPNPHTLTFWMRDTPTPLDIGFFTPGGVLAEIYPLLPFDERVVSSGRGDLQIAVEMRKDWYRDNQVRPGATLDMAAVFSAMKARGFDAAKYGLAPR